MVLNSMSFFLIETESSRFFFFFVPVTLASNFKFLKFFIIDFFMICFYWLYSLYYQSKMSRIFKILELIFEKFSFSIKTFDKGLKEFIENCIISIFIYSHLIRPCAIPFWSRMLKVSGMGFCKWQVSSSLSVITEKGS